VCPRTGSCSGELIHTISGGQLWEEIALPTVGRDLRTGRPSAAVGWVARADNGDSGPALATTVDGGATWTTRSTPCAGGAMVDFSSPGDGWLACSQPSSHVASPVSIYRTADGGTTWRAVGQVAAPPTPVAVDATRSGSVVAPDPMA